MIKTINTDVNQLAELIIQELLAARGRYPDHPDHPVLSVAICVEEAGEALKIANNLYWQHKEYKLSNVDQVIELRKELIQTAAMAMRALLDAPCLQVAEKTTVESL